MQSLLEEYVLSQLIVYILTFARVGTVMMIMPGIGSTFVSPNIRLMMALAFTVVLSPVTAQYLPTDITNTEMIWLIMTEMLIGFFIGTITRIFMAALDTAGMLISLNMGVSNAQIFNPQSATQGSIMGAFLSLVGAVLLFTTDLHHMLIFGMIDSYKTFPAGDALPSVDGMAQTVSLAVSKSFAIGFYMATPFIIVTLFLYIAMGVLGRLMPQIQVFVLAIPIQVMLGLLVMIMVFSTMMLYWLNHYDESIQLFFTKL